MKYFVRLSIFGLHLKTFICISIKNHNWKFKSVSTEQHTLPVMYLQLTQPKQKFDHLLITNCTQAFLLSSYVLCSYDFLKTLYAFLRIGYLYVYPQCHLARETKAIVGSDQSDRGRFSDPGFQGVSCEHFKARLCPKYER